MYIRIFYRISEAPVFVFQTESLYCDRATGCTSHLYSCNGGLAF